LAEESPKPQAWLPGLVVVWAASIGYVVDAGHTTCQLSEQFGFAIVTLESRP